MSQIVFLLSSLLCVAHCLIRSPSLPIRLPNNPLNTSCSLHRDYDAVRVQVREILDAYPPCSCAGAEGWTRVVHLNMSDMNQQCPSNWTLITTPVRGCGRTNNQRVCDSVTYPVHGLNYSHVCGRILAYQKGLTSAFYNSIAWSYLNTIERAYLSGVSLTHGPPGSRQHIWSFVKGI